MDPKTKVLLQSLSFPEESELHVSRHLMELPTRIASKTSITLQHRAKMYNGSKFFPEFIVDPNQLMSRIIKEGNLLKFNNVNYSRLELEFSFSEDQFPKGIGFCIEGSRCEVRNLVLILHRNKNKWEVTTSFPGSLQNRL